MGRAWWLRIVVVGATVAACFGHAIRLSSTSQETVVTPATVNFGNVTFGQEATRNITISPASGEQNDTIDAVTFSASCSDDFRFVTKPTLPAPVSSVCTLQGSDSCAQFATTSYTFSVGFRPEILQPQSCVVTVVVRGQNPRSIVLNGIGIPAPNDIDVEISSTRCKAAGAETQSVTCALPFGETNVNGTSTKTVDLVNVGSQTANIQSITVDNNQFAIVGGTAAAVAAGARRAFQILCQPQTAAPLVATVTIASDDPMGPHSFAVTCEGVLSQLIVEGALELETRVAELLPKDLELQNQSAALPLTIQSINIVDCPAPCPITVSAGLPLQIAASGNDTITVNYLPIAETHAEVGKLVLNLADGTQRTVTLQGAALETTVSLTPDGEPVNLGTTCAGSKKTTTFTTVASSEGGFRLRSVTSQTTTFSIVAPTTPADLQGNGRDSFEFDVEVTPTGFEPLPGAITLDTDIPKTSGGTIARTVLVQIRGLPPGPNLDPRDIVEFGSVEVAAQMPIPIEFTNCNPTNVVIGERIEGDPDYTITKVPASREVPPNTSVTYEVTLAPTFGGEKRARFFVDHEGASVSVPLDGNAIGPPRPDEGDPRDTYYHCSSGGASGLAGVLVVLAFTLRRRRSSNHASTANSAHSGTSHTTRA